MKIQHIVTFTFFLLVTVVVQAQTTKPKLTYAQLYNIAKLPLKCIEQEYPNKLGQVLGSKSDLQTPKSLHPSFFGCFDWHSAVHAHWSLVKILKNNPRIKNRQQIVSLLRRRITPVNIAEEVAFFEHKYNRNFERTYGWAWLLKLSAELHTWNTTTGIQLEHSLQPLTKLIRDRFLEFLDKLVYPIRVGEHANTAFALSFAWDYAETVNDAELLDAIEGKAREYYWDDSNCPIHWEPSGFDFLSPCLEEADLMSKVLAEEEFKRWIKRFLPQLKRNNLFLEPAKVGDRRDGKLILLDGLNFNRAWIFYNLANRFECYAHLRPLADKHLQYSTDNIFSDSYDGNFWLGTFALYAVDCANQKPRYLHQNREYKTSNRTRRMNN